MGQEQLVWPPRRVAPNGAAYTKQEFLQYFEGLDEWDRAEEVPACELWPLG